MSVRPRQRCPRCPHTPARRRGRGHAERSGLGWGCRSRWGCTQRPRAQGPLSTSQARRSKPGRGCPQPHPWHARQLSRAAGASRTSALRGLDSHCAAGGTRSALLPGPAGFRASGRVRWPGLEVPPSALFPRPASCRAAPPQAGPRGSLCCRARSASPPGAEMTSVRPGQGQVRAVDFLTISTAIVSHRDLGNNDRPNLSPRRSSAPRRWPGAGGGPRGAEPPGALCPRRGATTAWPSSMCRTRATASAQRMELMPGGTDALGLHIPEGTCSFLTDSDPQPQDFHPVLSLFSFLFKAPLAPPGSPVVTRSSHGSGSCT